MPRRPAPRRLALPAAICLAACAGPVPFVAQDPGGRVEGTLVGEVQEGPCIHYWPSGKKKAEGRYAGDVQVGPWTWWYEDGQKRCEGAFADEHRVGRWRYWHRDGRLHMEGFFDAGRKQGRWLVHDAGGGLQERGEYESGARCSSWSFFRAAATIHGWFHGGAKVGPWRFEQAGGTGTEARYPMPEGLELQRESWPGGGPRRAGFRRAGLREGRWLSWHATGALRASADFREDALQGAARIYDPSGELLAWGDVRAGRLTGTWRVRGAAGFDAVEVDATRPPGVFSGRWAPDDECASGQPLEIAERCLLELGAPFDAPELLETPPVADAAARELPAAVPPPVPPPVPPSFLTRRELRDLGSWVAAYTRELATSVFATYEAQPQRKDRSASRRLTGTTLQVRLRSAGGGEVTVPAGDGRRFTLLVLLRGFAGQVCPYCPMQLRALAPFRTQLDELGVRVVAVYPGPVEGVQGFTDVYAETFGDKEPPYAIYYDADSSLPRRLDLLDRSTESRVLARPSTFILDAGGRIRYAYVGRHKADRPAAETLIGKIRELSR